MAAQVYTGTVSYKSVHLVTLYKYSDFLSSVAHARVKSLSSSDHLGEFGF